MQEDFDMNNRPPIVCLCGSTRFCDEQYRNEHGMTPWQQATFDETLAGRIVLSVGVDFKSDAALGLTDSDKVRLDALHLAKIDLADEILVLNVGGYIGRSTAKEITFASEHGKKTRYLEERKEQ